jgi:CO/xanthine dehydrogenase Mo-binding subunit
VKKIGTGISLGVHPTGLKGGGDPSQAQIRLKADGTLDLMNGAVDIGQGCKTILRQLAADTLGVPLESITHHNFDTDVGPLCTGTFASRVTFMDGNAVITAANDLKEKIITFVAGMWGVDKQQLDLADGKVYVKDGSDKTMGMFEIGQAANWGGSFFVGTGAFIPGGNESFEKDTGKMSNVAALAYHACVAEVEVDTETGLVDVLKLVHVHDVGKAINPLLIRSQANGGAMMGIGFALTEDANPYYPSMDHVAHNLEDYYITTAADMPPKLVDGIVEIPNPNGPMGAKGFGENSASGPPAAILSAIHDAIGVWITDYPASPERVLRALNPEESCA